MVVLMALLLIIAFASGTSEGNLDVDRLPTYPFRF